MKELLVGLILYAFLVEYVLFSFSGSREPLTVLTILFVTTVVFSSFYYFGLRIVRKFFNF